MTDLDELIQMDADTIQKKVHQTNSALITAEANLKSAEKNLVAAKKVETVDGNTGISLDKNGKSMANLKCLIINGRDMPVMNTFNGKSDAYCEVTLDPPSLCPAFKSAKSETQWASLDPVFQMESIMSNMEGQVAEGRVKIEVYDDVENIEKLIKKKTLMGTVYLNLVDLMDQQMHTAWYDMDIPDSIMNPSEDIMDKAAGLFSSKAAKEKKIGALQIKSTLFVSTITPLVAEIEAIKAQLATLKAQHDAAVADNENYMAQKKAMAKEGETINPVHAETKKEDVDPNKLVLAPQEGEVQMRVHRALLRKVFTVNTKTELNEGDDIEAQYNDSPCYFQAQVLKVNDDQTYDIQYLDSTVNTNEPDFFDQYGILRRKDGEGTPLKAAGDLDEAEQKPNWLLSLVFGEDKKDADDEYTSTEN